MAIAGILASSFFNNITQSAKTNMTSARQEFQQLGQDLQAGNLSAAQSDLSAFEQLKAPASSTATAPNTNPVTQDLNQLSLDLQSGNVTAAQQDYTKIQQDLQSQSGQIHHHHHHGGGGGEASATSQLLSQMSQALQAGNLSSAQQSYSALQENFQQLALGRAFSGQSLSQSGSTGVSVSA